MDKNRNGVGRVVLRSSHPISFDSRIGGVEPDPVPHEDEPAADCTISMTPPRKMTTVIRRSETVRPDVSVVIPAYNAEDYVGESIRSVLDQRLPRGVTLEVIVVDDGSADGTLQVICDETARENRVTVITQPNGRTGAALNTGFEHARGKYQTWWSADSVMHPDCIRELRAALEASRSTHFAYSDWAIMDESGSHRGGAQRTPSNVTQQSLRTACNIGPCWLWRRELLDECGAFSTELCEDYDMHLRMRRKTRFCRVAKVLGYWRDHRRNLTATESIPTSWSASKRIQARDKWQDKGALRVAHVSPAIDSAGVGWWHARSFVQSNLPVAVRHIVRDQTFLGQQVDIPIETREQEARQVLAECDLIHWNGRLPEPDDLWDGFDPDVDLAGRPWIMHFHGGQYWWDLDQLARRCRHIATCTPHMESLVRGVKWMPNVLPITQSYDESSLFWPSESWPKLSGDTLTLCMHHNYPVGKGCDQIAWLIERLDHDHGIKIEQSIHSKNTLPIREHIESKKRFDIVVDQITQGFVGMAAWESMAQGAVVLARLDKHAIKHYRALGNGTLPPIVQCESIDHVATTLIDLARNPQRVEPMKRASRAWMIRYYSTQRILSSWHAYYKEVMNARR